MRITKQTEYAIKWLVSNNTKIEDIAKELNLTEKQVANYIEKHNLINQKPKTASDLMITETSNKRNKNVAIMTQEASMFGDQFRKNMNNKKDK
jgi:predicted transcriptional regulator